MNPCYKSCAEGNPGTRGAKIEQGSPDCLWLDHLTVETENTLYDPPSSQI